MTQPFLKNLKGTFYLDTLYIIYLLNNISIYLPRRHAGDLGNIVTLTSGITQVTITDSVITLGDGGINDVAGLAVVVHVEEDDLGRGGDDQPMSVVTGNAGAKVACGIIELI